MLIQNGNQFTRKLNTNWYKYQEIVNFPVPVSECQDACIRHGMRLVTIEVGVFHEIIRGFRSCKEFREDLIIATAAREDLGARSVVYGRSGTKHKINIHFYKSNQRRENRAGTYGIFIYYGAYLSRPAMLDTNDWCGCRTG